MASTDNEVGRKKRKAHSTFGSSMNEIDLETIDRFILNADKGKKYWKILIYEKDQIDHIERCVENRIIQLDNQSRENLYPGQVVSWDSESSSNDNIEYGIVIRLNKSTTKIVSITSGNMWNISPSYLTLVYELPSNDDDRFHYKNLPPVVQTIVQNYHSYQKISDEPTYEAFDRLKKMFVGFDYLHPYENPSSPSPLSEFEYDVSVTNNLVKGCVNSRKRRKINT